MTVIGKHVNVDQYEIVLGKINQVLKRYKISYEIDGLYYNLMISQKQMVGTLFKTFFTGLLIITLVAFLAIRKVKVISSFLVVNILPIGLSFLFLYYLGLSLNIATVMTYSIGLGMVVDSSFHMIHALSNGGSFNHFVNTTTKPIITSSIILIFSFILFMFYDFIPIKQFGVNLAFIIFVGMVFDLLLLPTLYLGHNRIREVFHG